MFLIIGLSLLLILIHRLGWEEVWSNIKEIGWGFVLLLIIGLLSFICITFSWFVILRSLGHQVSFNTLLRLKIIAEAVNDIFPTANLGGEGVRFAMLKKTIPSEVASASILIDKTTDSIGKLIFILVGTATSLLFIPLPAEWVGTIVLVLILLTAINVAIVLIQIKSSIEKSSRIFEAISFLKKRIDKYQKQIAQFHHLITNFYSSDRGTLITATFWHFIRRSLGVFEVLLIMWLITEQTTLEDSLYITVMTMVASNAYFIIPGQWGVAEGTQVFLVNSLGYSTAIGLSLGLIRRIRLMVFSLIGLLLYRSTTNAIVPIATKEANH